MRTVAIIQARMESTRLPGKVLAEVCRIPMIELIVQRVRASKTLDGVVVATTANPADERLSRLLRDRGVDVFRGSEMDVLDRYTQCARSHAADIVVRITADDPFKDAQIIDEAVLTMQDGSSLDYVSNTIAPTFPEGLDVEVIRRGALEAAFRLAKKPSEREHVTPYIWSRAEEFKLRNIDMVPNLSHWRWTVDHPADLRFAQTVFEKLGYNPLVPYQAIIELLRKEPQLLSINEGTPRNEGYLKSQQMESGNA